MLTCRIAPHRATRKAPEVSAANYLKHDAILARQLLRCKFHVGDTVYVQTNKGPKKGIVCEIVTKASEVEWRNGSQPFFICIRLPLLSIVDGTQLAYGNEIIYAPLKKVRF